MVIEEEKNGWYFEEKEGSTGLNISKILGKFDLFQSREIDKFLISFGTF